MPMPILSIPPFPDVPALPGVPALARSLTASVAAGINGLLINAGLSSVSIALALPTWGVFDVNGLPVAVADSVRELAYHSESDVSDYPQEQGAFESYNKVQRPYIAGVSLTCGGDAARRAAFLSSCQAAKDSTDLFSIVTPEMVYLNANITELNYRRTTRDGAGLLTVDLHIEQIRVSASAAFDNVLNPASAETASQGQVQALAPSAGMATLFGPTTALQGTGGV